MTVDAEPIGHSRLFISTQADFPIPIALRSGVMAEVVYRKDM
jgi:hypothetical protein